MSKQLPAIPKKPEAATELTPAPLPEKEEDYFAALKDMLLKREEAIYERATKRYTAAEKSVTQQVDLARDMFQLEYRRLAQLLEVRIDAGEKDMADVWEYDAPEVPDEVARFDPKVFALQCFVANVQTHGYQAAAKTEVLAIPQVGNMRFSQLQVQWSSTTTATATTTTEKDKEDLPGA